MDKKEFTKVKFSIEQDEDGYPPVDNEFVWSTSIGDDKFILESIPFFAVSVSYKDVVRAYKAEEGFFVFDGLEKASGHSTIRIIIYDKSNENIESIRGDIVKLLCGSEGSHIKGLISIDIPPSVNYSEIVQYLDKKASEDVLDYEESCIAH